MGTAKLARRAGRAGLITVAALALTIPGVLIGQASTTAVRSTVSITHNTKAATFNGKVGSESPRCRRRRNVSIFKIKPGPNPVIGRGKTNRSGRYRVSQPGAHGHFYARVPRKVIPGYDRTIVCRGARSRTIEVG